MHGLLFNEPYQNFPIEDKVLLYCYFNMRKHYFSSYFVFDKIIDFHKWFPQNPPTIFIDLGCGPLTSALALADYYKAKTNKYLKFNYIGVDIALSMLKKAEEFSQIDNFTSDCQFSFIEDWFQILNILEPSIESESKIIFNASYLFASNSLNEIELANSINTIMELYSQNQTIFIFQNPNNSIRNRKYDIFKNSLKYLNTSYSDVDTVYYKNKKYGDLRDEPVYYELLSNS